MGIQNRRRGESWYEEKIWKEERIPTRKDLLASCDLFLISVW